MTVDLPPTPGARGVWPTLAAAVLLAVLVLVVVRSTADPGSGTADGEQDGGHGSEVGTSAEVGGQGDAVGGAAADEELPAFQEEARTVAALDEVDVVARVGQARHLEGTPRLDVGVSFDTDADVEVGSIRIESTMFGPTLDQPKRSLLQAGRFVDLQTDVGPAVCPAPGSEGVADDDPAHAAPDVVDASRAVLSAGVVGTEPQMIIIDLPERFLAERRDAECAVRRVTDVAQIHLVDPVRAIDATEVELDLVLTRRAGGGDAALGLRLEGLLGSVLLTFDPTGDPEAGPDDPPLLLLEPGAAEARLPIVIDASRCDPHAVSGSQRTFVFGAWMRLDGQPQVFAEFGPDEAVTEVLRAAISACVAEG